nr:MAG TPA: hypothetical protein [Caudoviricetes sp.]
MTDYEKGILVGIALAWPIISISTLVVIGVFVAGGRTRK